VTKNLYQFKNTVAEDIDKFF